MFEGVIAWAVKSIIDVNLSTPNILESIIASPSSLVKVSAEPAAPFCPSSSDDPGSMNIRLVPNALNSSITPFTAPWPIAINTITELTPIIIPRVVSKLLKVFERIALKDIKIRSKMLIYFFCPLLFFHHLLI